jgi:MarR family transcriptional regulator for hemolysin
MKKQNLYPFANEIYVYAALLLKFFNQSLEERLRNHGVTISGLHHSILGMLRFEELTISTICQRMGMDPATMVRIIDSLERKELVQRGHDPHDRRRNPIHITEKGIELITLVPVISDQDLTYQGLQSLGFESALQLRDLLHKLIQQFPEGRLVSEVMSGQPSHSITSIDSNDPLQ